MMCDLCQKQADQVIRVDSWLVCQLCVSNKVLEHALEVNMDIAKLREAVANTSIAHQDDVRKQEKAEARLELAYKAYDDLATASKELAAVSADADTSLEVSLAATKALVDYKAREHKRSRKARQGKGTH